jgi:hypothetical protein
MEYLGNHFLFPIGKQIPIGNRFLMTAIIKRFNNLRIFRLVTIPHEVIARHYELDPRELDPRDGAEKKLWSQENRQESGSPWLMPEPIGAKTI